VSTKIFVGGKSRLLAERIFLMAADCGVTPPT
jgi:hypothetical protein